MRKPMEEMETALLKLGHWWRCPACRKVSTHKLISAEWTDDQKRRLAPEIRKICGLQPCDEIKWEGFDRMPDRIRCKNCKERFPVAMLPLGAAWTEDSVYRIPGAIKLHPGWWWYCQDCKQLNFFIGAVDEMGGLNSATIRCAVMNGVNEDFKNFEVDWEDFRINPEWVKCRKCKARYRALCEYEEHL